MSVSLPSDLIMDVMRNADPVRREAAAAKLKSTGDSSGPDATFADVTGAIASPGISSPKEGLLPPGGTPGSSMARAESPYQGFERMVLRNLFETLLPDSDSGAFGSGPSAGIWRSMAADQMAGVYADAGGVGIAEMLQQQSGESPARQAQWPYFSVNQIAGFKG